MIIDGFPLGLFLSIFDNYLHALQFVLEGSWRYIILPSFLILVS
jgi:hypothetical protein